MFIVANQIDVFAFDNLSVMKTVVISYLIANEGLSILENLDRLVVKVAKGLTKFLEKLIKTMKKSIWINF
ncbi:holin [Enterococcus sp. MMGLQ5-2]|nr:phage holin family protein [Enterococcus sp. MMGLQ5-2]MBS7583980.1 phage holin family protein [Enterococcus sp. MMGLQ5-1]NPD11841.1 holin [Enterococcus sp. MMGLQ5-1]NPD36370.1 holin [Enterococcus sp. MMGLQ5-2]